MSSAYEELLDATIRHLEGLKSRGVRHVPVAPETLQALVKPPVKSPVASFRSQQAPIPVAPVAPATVSRIERSAEPAPVKAT
ncbi:MAG TPA: uracil-DNA glycosylase, partial [Verrucomicrobiae bacterium]